MNFKRFGAAAMTLMLLLSVFAAGSAAAATTTLAGDGTDTVSGFTANESNALEYSISSSGTDFSTDGTTQLKMNVTHDGEQYAMTEEAVDSGTSASQIVNISNDELSDLPGDAGETVTVNVTAWGTDGNGTETTTATEFAVDITFDNTYAVASVDDSSAEIEDVEAGYLSSFSFGVLGTEDPADLHTYDTTVGIDGNNTTVTVLDETSNGSDVFTDAVGDDLESGDVITGATVAADGEPILAFYDSADTDIIEDGDTYAVYNSGDNSWTIHTGSAQEGATSMDVLIESQDYTNGDFDSEALTTAFVDKADLGIMDLGSAFGYTSIFTNFDVLSVLGVGMIVPAGGLSLAFLIPAGRKRLGA